MRTVVLGKNIEHFYEIDSKRQDIKRSDGTYDTVFTDKPVLTTHNKIIDWEEILSYDGEPRYNNDFDPWSSHIHKMCISETDIVCAEREVFRADLNEVHVYTDRIMTEIEMYKEEAEREYAELVALFNKQMIESNDKMKAYCDLHKLNYEETDCTELFKLVYPDESWEIKDGKMQVASKGTITGSLCGSVTWKPVVTMEDLEKYDNLIKTQVASFTTLDGK